MNKLDILDPQRIASQVPAEAQGGSPLPRHLRERLERSLGAELSNVRIHEGLAADRMARAGHRHVGDRRLRRHRTSGGVCRPRLLRRAWLRPGSPPARPLHSPP